MCKSLDNTTTNIIKLRKEFRLSREAFAGMAGRTKRMVKLWETGECSPNAQTLWTLVTNFERKFGIRLDLNEMVLGELAF